MSIVEVSAQCSATTNNAGTVDVGCNVFGTSSPIPSTAYRTFVVINGVDYTISTCGSGWDTQLTLRDNNDNFKAYNDDSGPDCSALQASIAWTADFSGTAKAYVHRYNCGSILEGTSAILKVKQNTTVSNTTSTANICEGGTKALTASYGGTYSGAPTVTYSVVAGSGSVSGTTYTHSGATGSVTIRATLGACSSDRTFTVVAGPTANAGPALAAICQGATSAAMGGSVGGSATGGTWSGGAGTWTNATSPSGATYTAASGESGTITLTLTTTGGSCGAVVATKTITVNQNPTANAGGALAAICQSGTSGSMGGSIGGGAISGSWSGGGGSWSSPTSPVGATYTASASESGSITLTLTASSAFCGNTTATKTITVNPKPTANAGSALAAICPGATSAAMGGSVGGGATGGTWSGGAGTWSNASNPATATYTAGLGESGTVTLTLTTSGGSCGITTVTKTINISATPTANAGPTLPTICQGATSAIMGGSVGGGATGGTWSGGAGSWLNANDPANAQYVAGTSESGSITLTLTASGPCGTKTATKTITVSPSPVSPSLGAKSPNISTVCEGQTVSATITAGSGGVGCSDVYQYRRRTISNAYDPWASYTSGASIATAGYNLVEIQVERGNCNPSSGCSSTGFSTIASWVVNPQPANPTLGAKSPNSTSVCEGQNVSATINAGTGGVGCSDVYEYRTRSTANVWSAWTVYISGSAITTTSLNKVEVRVQRGGCNASAGCTSTSPVVIADWDIFPQATISITPSQTVCSGSGVLLNATVVGGNGSGTYQWQVFSGGVWVNVGTNNDNYTTPVLLSTTLYRCSFTPSAPGCGIATSTTTTLTVVPNPTISIGTAQTICNGGSVTLSSSVSGGTGTTTYQWQYFDGITWQNVGGNTSTLNTGALSATTDYRCIYSANGLGCTAATSNTVTITVAADPTVSISASATYCGSGSSTLNAVGAGGTGTMVYQWQSSPDNSTWSNVGTNSSSYSTGTVSSTTYYRTKYYTSGVGCDTAYSNVVTITIQPSLANNTISPTYQKFCASGTSTLLIGGLPTGGNGTYTYTWEVSVNNGGTWSSAPGLNAGIDYQPPFTNSTVWYRRVVTSGTCSDNNNLSIINVLPLPSFVSVAKTDVKCFGGSDGTISASGSSANGGVLYSLNGGAFQTSPFTGLAANSYTITIRDDSLCSVTYPTPIVVSQPTVLAASVDSSKDASCSGVFDGHLYSSASGGVAPYQYSLNGGPFQISPNFSNIASGFYTLTAIDANGCLATDTVTISNQYTVSANLDSVKNVSCFGGNDGEVYVTLTGGILPYNYSINGITFQPIPVFTGLTANNYVVTLKDAKGCAAYLTANVSQPGLLSVLIDSVVNSLCNGGSTGGIYTSTAGGTAPYSYVWSNGSLSDDLINVPANTYNVTVTDSKGCTAVGGASISQPIALAVNVASFGNVLCNGDSSGSVDISVAGGTPPYAFNWSNGKATEDILNVYAGTYSVTVTDANGCTKTISQTISEPSLLGTSITAVNLSCNGGSNGSIDLTVNGGTLPYNYIWSNGQATQDLSNLNGGTYYVTVTDKNGCSARDSVIVTEPSAVQVSMSTVNVLCNGDSGTATASVSGGTTPYNYLWSNGGTSNSISDVAGTYSLTVTDGNGCIKSK
ncbi:MAG: SprB repeat-containing protein [Chitinophagales bacterium]|nr:SprB repeat-containing protein [Chitinophagales bacterium]